jgi:hypothetical protein
MNKNGKLLYYGVNEDGVVFLYPPVTDDEDPAWLIELHDNHVELRENSNPAEFIQYFTDMEDAINEAERIFGLLPRKVMESHGGLN